MAKFRPIKPPPPRITVMRDGQTTVPSPREAIAILAAPKRRPSVKAIQARVDRLERLGGLLAIVMAMTIAAVLIHFCC
jgi:hypothetical protein